MPQAAYAWRACAVCGEQFTPFRHDQRYCGKTCRVRRPSLTVYVECAWCGSSTAVRERDVGRYPAHYCDKSCAQKGRHASGVGYLGRLRAKLKRASQAISTPPVLMLTSGKRCLQCGVQPVTVGCSRYCSEECRGEATRAYGRQWNAENRPHEHKWYGHRCADCGTPFLSSSSTGRYCSEACAVRNARRRHKRQRRARERGNGPIERIDLPTLAERDGWRCHLCRKRVTRKTWSIDHLVPLVDGGAHTYDNVALAHHRCNSLRQDGGLVQLRLAA
jgi:hypothetical protein